MKKILFSADKNARVAVALVANAGLRPEVLGDYKGNDGLMVGDFPEMKIEQGEVSFKKIPTLIVVRPELSKARHQYLYLPDRRGVRIPEVMPGGKNQERGKTGERFLYHRSKVCKEEVHPNDKHRGHVKAADKEGWIFVKALRPPGLF